MSVSHVAERTEKIAKSDAEWRALLFISGAKFETGIGWPSFDRPTSGRVFPGGPRQTMGQRYGINGAALAFKPGDP